MYNKIKKGFLKVCFMMNKKIFNGVIVTYDFIISCLILFYSFICSCESFNIDFIIVELLSVIFCIILYFGQLKNLIVRYIYLAFALYMMIKIDNYIL